MDRYTAHNLCKSELTKHGLADWGVRISISDKDKAFLGLCSYKDNVIILNGFHVDIHPDAEIIDTIKHEVAHALTPGHGHDNVWADKAREIGCTNTLPCSHLGLPEHVIDAIRSGQLVEMTVEETTHIVRTPKYNITQLKDKCPVCGKDAVEKFNITTIDRDGNDVRLITLACFHIIKKVIPRGTPFESIISNGWKDEIKACKHKWPTEADRPEDWPPNQCYTCGEFKLLPFQIVGAKALEAGMSTQKGFGLFDDMGLGKTVEALSYIYFHKEASPTLYVVKSGIKFQFYKEIVRFLGLEYAGQIISTGKDFIFPGLKTYIISFDLIKRIPREKMLKLGIKTVVIDECQQIKNPDSARTQELRRFIGASECKVIPISGTPWKNRGSEFFSVLNMIDPIKFYSYQRFLDKEVEYYWEGSKRKMGGIRNPERFRKENEHLFIRREYEEVMGASAPFVNRTKLNIKLDDLSQSSYDDEVSAFVKWYNQAVIDGVEESLNSMEVLAKLSRMRHITGLAKIPATLGFIEEFIEDTSRKLVVFVHHIDVGNILINELTGDSELAKELRSNGILIMKLTSEFSDAEKFAVSERFNKANRVIMIASTLSAGEGVNLQTCHDTIMHERQWNPQNEDQAAPGRFRRLGQLSKVINITFVEAEGTVDEHLDGIVSVKRRQFHEGMNKGAQITWSESDIIKGLIEKIVSKHKAKNKTNITEMTQYTGATQAR